MSRNCLKIESRKRMWYFLSALMFQIFICSRKHQLDPIELVDFAGSRIKVDCYDIGSRISSSELFDDTFSYHVVRQAGKWLCADNICQRLRGSAPASLRLKTILHRSGFRWKQSQMPFLQVFRSWQVASKCVLSSNALLAGARNHSSARIPRFPSTALDFFMPRWDTLKFWL